MPPAPPPDLPSRAKEVRPLVFDVTIRQQGRQGQVRVVRESVTRTVDRIHIRRADGPEWLFERNAVDMRRASGYLIDHASRSVVFYSDSDLRARFAISGWAHVLTLGFDTRLLEEWTRSPIVRTLGGMRFTKFVGAGTTRAEVWWNADNVLPAEYVMRDAEGTTKLSLANVRAADDLGVLEPPSSRFPEYPELDLADWLERH
jgi:hypothetical protein